jgi:hypothetical protein
MTWAWKPDQCRQRGTATKTEEEAYSANLTTKTNVGFWE